MSKLKEFQDDLLVQRILARVAKPKQNKKQEASVRMGQTLARRYFDMFGPNAKKNYRGNSFEYPTSLYLLVEDEAEMQSKYNHNLDVKLVVQSANEEIRKLVNTR